MLRTNACKEMTTTPTGVFFFCHLLLLLLQGVFRSPRLLLRRLAFRRRLRRLRRDLLLRRRAPPPLVRHDPDAATSVEKGLVVGEAEVAAEAAAMSEEEGGSVTFVATNEEGAVLAMAVEEGRLSWMTYKTKVQFFGFFFYIAKCFKFFLHMKIMNSLWDLVDIALLNQVFFSQVT